MFLQPHTVSVRTKTGTSGVGTLYSDPATVRCWADDKTRMVRTSDGAQVVSSTTLYTSDSRDLWAEGSEVTVFGRTTTVISVARRDDSSLGGWQHTEVSLA
jgi:hypothetical protein